MDLYGFFRWPLQGEFSTIDTSIMIAGAIFAGNYFGREVEIYADILKSIPNWGTTICDESQEKDCSGIFMISDENHESSNENGMRGQTRLGIIRNMNRPDIRWVLCPLSPR